MNLTRLIAIAAVAGLAVVGTTFSLEKKLNRSDFPPAIEETVVVESRGAQGRGFSEEKENGQTYYEAEMMLNGHSNLITSGVWKELLPWLKTPFYNRTIRNSIVPAAQHRASRAGKADESAFPRIELVLRDLDEGFTRHGYDY